MLGLFSVLLYLRYVWICFPIVGYQRVTVSVRVTSWTPRHVCTCTFTSLKCSLSEWMNESQNGTGSGQLAQEADTFITWSTLFIGENRREAQIRGHQGEEWGRNCVPVSVTLLVRVEPQKKPRHFPHFGEWMGLRCGHAGAWRGWGLSHAYLGEHQGGIWKKPRWYVWGGVWWEEILTELPYILGRRRWERRVGSRAGGKKRRKKRRFHLIARMVEYGNIQSILTSVYSWGLAGLRDTSAGLEWWCPSVGIASWPGEHMDPWFRVHMSLDI